MTSRSSSRSTHRRGIACSPRTSPRSVAGDGSRAVAVPGVVHGEEHARPRSRRRRARRRGRWRAPPRRPSPGRATRRSAAVPRGAAGAPERLLDRLRRLLVSGVAAEDVERPRAPPRRAWRRRRRRGPAGRGIRRRASPLGWPWVMAASSQPVRNGWPGAKPTGATRMTPPQPLLSLMGTSGVPCAPCEARRGRCCRARAPRGGRAARRATPPRPGGRGAGPRPPGSPASAGRRARPPRRRARPGRAGAGARRGAAPPR